MQEGSGMLFGDKPRPADWFNHPKVNARTMPCGPFYERPPASLFVSDRNQAAPPKFSKQ